MGGQLGREPRRSLPSVILVDSSAWIDHLRDTATEQVSHLRSLMPGEELLVGDLVLCEVLQGLRSDAEARLVEEALREFEVVPLVDPELAVKGRRELSVPAQSRIYGSQDDRSACRYFLHRARPFAAAQRSGLYADAAFSGPADDLIPTRYPSGSKRRSMSPVSRPAPVPPAVS